MRKLFLLSGLLALMTGVCRGDETLLRVSAPRTDDQGFQVHTVRSSYQAEPTGIRVLLPDKVAVNQRYPVVYVLPVEAARGNRYGDGLIEVKTHDLHNKHQAIFVAPTFTQLPWYADHPDDQRIQQETYFVKVVVHVVEQNYPAVQKAESRLLLGFSKSGWGAWSLLLRYPETFGRAAAWDAPLMMTDIGKYGNRPIFGTQANFLKYRLTDRIRAQAKLLREKPRLILTGYAAGFRQEHIAMHNLLKELRILHEHRDGPQRKHEWHSGWVPEAVELLLPTAK